MAEERFGPVRRLFGEALERPADERGEFLERACAGDAELLRDVQALLEREEAADPRLERPAMTSFLATVHGNEAGLERIGEFRILGILGRGGMGVVYEAEQQNPRRPVALKVVRSPFVTEEDLRRFELEGRTLAWLNHPGIAAVYATGVADTGHGPQPYLAMELVRGERLDVHAERAGLDVAQRLELLAEVADAIHHAHQKGVIHRDLKPGNVLVDEAGKPKVLDFGVARVLGEGLDATTRCTRAGEILGTLAYMSPEQVRADPDRIDVRSDVYALGVIGYELLARRRPLQLETRELPAAIQAILLEEPRSLGDVERGLRGDVETIVHKAMAKERERRYGSAAALAEDLRRFLAQEPILARPASRSYQLRKFVRRNRGLVGGLAAVFLALVAGTVTSTLLYLEKETQRAAASQRGEELALALDAAQEAERRAGDERARAATEAETAQAVTDYLVSLFEHANPEERDAGSPDEPVTAFELLDEGVERIRGRFESRPEVRARLLDTFGKVNNFLRRFERSGPILEEALELTTEVHGEDSVEVADTLERLAWVRMEAGDLAAAEGIQERVLDLRGRLLGKEHRLYGDALNNLASTLSARSAFPEAQELYHRARDVYAALGREEEVAFIDYNLGTVATELGRFDEAETLLRAALETQLRLLGPSHWRTLYTQLALAANAPPGEPIGSPLRLELLGFARAAHSALVRLFGPESPLALRAEYILGNCLREAGELDRALLCFEELLQRQEQARGQNPDTTRTLLALARTLHDAGRVEDAEALYLDALDRIQGQGLLQDDSLAVVRHNLAQIYLADGRLAQALELEQAALAERERTLGRDHPSTVTSRENLAAIRTALGNAGD